MSVFAWATRRSGGLAMITLLALCYWVISKEATAPKHPYEWQDHQHVKPDPTTTTMGGAGNWTVVFAYYCLLIHFLVFVFPLRACWSIVDLTKSLKKVRQRTLRELKLSGQRRGSSTSLSSSETLGSVSSPGSSAASSEAGDLEAELADHDVTTVIQAIVVPNYKEEMDTLRETLDVLASHPQAAISYDVSNDVAGIWPNIRSRGAVGGLREDGGASEDIHDGVTELRSLVDLGLRVIGFGCASPFAREAVHIGRINMG